MDRSVGLAGASLGEEVAAPVAGALVGGHGGAVLAGGGALGQQVVAGVHPRPAGAGVAARLLRARAQACIRVRNQVTHARTDIYEQIYSIES